MLSSSSSTVLAHQRPCSSQCSLLQVLREAPGMHLLAQVRNTWQQRSAVVQQQQVLPLLPLLLWLQRAWSGRWTRSWATTRQTNSSSSKCRDSSKSL
jgi:hypothetical protein